jgi:Exostosin family
MNIFLSSCVGPAAESVYCAELGRLAGLCWTEDLKLVSTPETADLILIVDIFEADLYAGLRRNRIWQKWPEKSFAYCEGDCPPTFLHGLHSSASKALSGSGRFQACAYPVHQLCYPNPCPSGVKVAATPKDLLFCFAGRDSHRVRRQLFAQKLNRPDVLVEDTSRYYHFADDAENRVRVRHDYWQMAARSKYALCPRGAGLSSMRIFEMMETGIPPVIVADDWLPPLGASWEEFALFVPEREISSIYEKVKVHEHEYADRGRLARQAWEQYFSPENYWSFILRSIREIQENQRYPELLYARSLSLLAVQEWGRQRRIRTSIRLKSGLKKCFQKINANSPRYGVMLR